MVYLETVEILNMLGISNCKSGYYLKDHDLAFICDQFNFNLYIIHEHSDYTNAIIYWKLNRENLGIFNKIVIGHQESSMKHITHVNLIT